MRSAIRRRASILARFVWRFEAGGGSDKAAAGDLHLAGEDRDGSVVKPASILRRPVPAASIRRRLVFASPGSGRRIVGIWTGGHAGWPLHVAIGLRRRRHRYGRRRVLR